MARPNVRGLVAAMLFAVLLLALASGCASSPSSKGFGLAPQGHKLLDTAKDMRAANLQALAIPREFEKEPLAPFVVEAGDVLLIQPVDLDSPVRLPGASLLPADRATWRYDDQLSNGARRPRLCSEPDYQGITFRR